MKQSVIRTLVPVIVGLLVTWGIKDATGLDDAALTQLVTLVVTGVYYVTVRYLEKHNDQWGFLLGAKGAPVYPTAEPPQA